MKKLMFILTTLVLVNTSFAGVGQNDSAECKAVSENTEKPAQAPTAAPSAKSNSVNG